ncbi:MAG: DUF1080 domain-containing protein [Verrucomicrobiota bacterium]
MKTVLSLFGILSLSLASTALAEDGFVQIFNGEDLTGWKVNKENPDSVSVKDGVMVVAGPRTHVFYDGAVGDHDFKNFEFKCKVKTTPGSNSGIYFHTEYQDSGWPDKGYEAQVNNTHKDPRKTASLYAVEDNHEAPVKDDEWFDYHIKVEGKRITLSINGKVIIDFTESDDNMGHLKKMPGRKLSSGTIAFQAHDPDSAAYYKDIYLKVND